MFVFCADDAVVDWEEVELDDLAIRQHDGFFAVGNPEQNNRFSAAK